MGDGSVLTLLANMASTPELSPAAQPEGRLVYATEKNAGSSSAAPLPPWAVAWFVDETEAGRS
jgi:hypothetical protein